MSKVKWVGAFLIVLPLMYASVFTERPITLGSGSVAQIRLSPEEALSILSEGNARFVKGDRKFSHLTKDRVAETAGAQEPFATLLACSDSRVPVEHVFDAGIGDLFVIRVAGNVCSDHEVGSIEYGVDHLNTPVVVVLGHTRCGAVTAVVENAHVRGKFPHLAEHIEPAHHDALLLHPNCDIKTVIDKTVTCNVRRAINDLLKSSNCIRSRVESGKVKLIGAVYDLGSGRVEWLSQ